MICPKCGADNDEQARFCSACGEPFQAPVKKTLKKAASNQTADSITAEASDAPVKKTTRAKKPEVEAPVPEATPVMETPAPEVTPVAEAPAPAATPAAESPVPEVTPAAEAPVPEVTPVSEAPAPAATPAAEPTAEAEVLNKKTLRKGSGYVRSAPTYAAPPVHSAAPYGYYERDNSGLAIASVILGIVGLCLGFTVIFSFPLGALAVVFGIISMKSEKRDLAIVGLVTGALAVCAALFIIVLFASTSSLASDFSSSFNIPFDGATDFFQY